MIFQITMVAHPKGNSNGNFFNRVLGLVEAVSITEAEKKMGLRRCGRPPRQFLKLAPKEYSHHRILIMSAPLVQTSDELWRLHAPSKRRKK